MSFDVDDLLPAEEVSPKESAGMRYAPTKPTRQDTEMGATAKELNLPEGYLKAKTNAYEGRVQGYSYGSNTPVSNVALTNNISHFERMHKIASDLERHATEHQAALDATDLSKEQRQTAQGHLDRVFSHLSDVYTKNGLALKAHLEGKHPTAIDPGLDTEHTLSNVADSMHLATASLKSSLSTVGAKPSPLLNGITNKTVDTVNEYNDHVKSERPDVTTKNAQPETVEATPVARRLPLRSKEDMAKEYSERAAASAERAKQMPMQGARAEGAEQPMMGRRQLIDKSAARRRRQVYTASGGFAPQADVAAAERRQRAKAADMLAEKENQRNELTARRDAERQARAKALGTDPARVAQDRADAEISSEKAKSAYRSTTPELQEAQSAQSRRAQFVAQEKARLESVDQESRQARVESITAQQEAEVKQHIDNGHYGKAAIAHWNSTSLSYKTKLSKKDQQLKATVANNPVRYLSTMGYDLGAEAEGKNPALRAQKKREAKTMPSERAPKTPAQTGPTWNTTSETYPSVRTTGVNKDLEPEKAPQYDRVTQEMMEEQKNKKNRRNGEFGQGQVK